jgi:uncharacterized protein (DUF2141 family)
MYPATCNLQPATTLHNYFVDLSAMKILLLTSVIYGLSLLIPWFSGTGFEYHELQQGTGHIELIISNIRNDKGWIRIGMYTSEKGYPNDPPFSFAFPKDSLVDGRLRLILPVHEPGSYALSFLDDENNNDKMDYRLGVIPREGFAFSNNPKIRGMKEPSFNETRFTYSGGKKRLDITMKYIF